MRRRAEHVDATRLRITEAAVRLHTTIGPANTSIAGVAEEAGVTRLTLYRHFPTIDALFAACTAHWMALHPMPDATRWSALPTLEARAEAVLLDLYGWYRAVDAELYPTQRDLDASPDAVREGMRRSREAFAATVLGDDSAQDTPALRALAGHLVNYWTWRSLVRAGGLTDAEGAALGASLLGSILGGQPR